MGQSSIIVVDIDECEDSHLESFECCTKKYDKRNVNVNHTVEKGLLPLALTLNKTT